MSITKIIELLSIETIHKHSFLKIKVTSFEEQIFFWEVDQNIAQSLIEICQFHDPYRFRLSLQTTFDKRANQYISYVTKTYRDQSEKIHFHCSETYHNQLEKIKHCNNIEEFNVLPFLYETLPTHEELQKEQVLENVPRSDDSTVHPTDIESLESLNNVDENAQEVTENPISPSVENNISEEELQPRDHQPSNEEMEVEHHSTRENKSEKIKPQTNTSKSKNGQNKQTQKWMTVSLIAAILLIVLIILFDVFNQKSNINEDSNANQTFNQPNNTNNHSGESTNLQGVSENEVPALHIEDQITFNIPDGYVAITINEGPSKYTKKIVDILKQNGVGGTFFFIGYNVQKHPDVVEYVHENGYPIGSLSMTHKTMTEQTFEEQQYEVKQSKKMIENIINEPIHLFRPPYGLFDENTQKVVSDLESQMVLWNIDPRDWKIQNPTEIIEHIRKTKTSGSIIVLHESQQLVDMLPSIIEVLKEQNLKIVSLN